MPAAPAPISIYGGFAMVNNIVPIPGYVHLYRSMLRFYDMPSAELKEMLYLLNTANLDSYGFHHPEAHVVESGPVAFCGWLDQRYAALTGRKCSFINPCWL